MTVPQHALDAAEEAWPHETPAGKADCGETTRYQPLAFRPEDVTGEVTVVCERPAGHDGRHAGTGYGGEQVLWPVDADPPILAWRGRPPSASPGT